MRGALGDRWSDACDLSLTVALHWAVLPADRYTKFVVCPKGELLAVLREVFASDLKYSTS